MENHDIKAILKDLYQYDPGLKQYEDQVIKTIHYLLVVKPDTLFDEAFAKQLRAQLMAKASLMEKPKNNNFNFMKLNYIISGLLAVALIVVGVNYYKQPKSDLENINLFQEGENITKVGDNAFGEIALNSEAARFQGGGGGLGAGGAESFNAGTQTETDAKISAPAYGIGGGGAGMIIPPFYGYNYSYTGDEFNIDREQMEVYRRTKSGFNSNSLDSLLYGLNFGLVNLGTFNSLTTDSITLKEDRDFGYMFYLNFAEGMLSINENWLKWQTPDRQCTDPSCYDRYRLSLSDIPEDFILIDIANKFLADHNISTQNYGEPIVQNFWEAEYRRAEDKSSVYIPDIVSVIYPLIVDDQEAYDEGGNKTGLNVAVNVRVNKVSGVYELRANNYEASDYAVETDTQALIAQAEKGGFNNWFFAENADAKTIELGTPRTALIRYYNYKNGQTEELYIPSLIFPITSAPEGEPYFSQKNVVVPLVKGLIERPDIMPLMEPAVSEEAR